MKRLLIIFFIISLVFACDSIVGHPGMDAENGVKQIDTWWSKIYKQKTDGFHKVRVEFNLYLFESDKVAEKEWKKISEKEIPSNSGFIIIYSNNKFDIWIPLAYSKGNAAVNNWALGHEVWEILYAKYKRNEILIPFGNPDLVYTKEFYK